MQWTEAEKAVRILRNDKVKTLAVNAPLMEFGPDEVLSKDLTESEKNLVRKHRKVDQQHNSKWPNISSLISMVT